jgi:hypothetical protein
MLLDFVRLPTNLQLFKLHPNTHVKCKTVRLVDYIKTALNKMETILAEKRRRQNLFAQVNIRMILQSISINLNIKG